MAPQFCLTPQCRPCFVCPVRTLTCYYLSCTAVLEHAGVYFSAACSLEESLLSPPPHNSCGVAVTLPRWSSSLYGIKPLSLCGSQCTVFTQGNILVSFFVWSELHLHTFLPCCVLSQDMMAVAVSSYLLHPDVPSELVGRELQLPVGKMGNDRKSLTAKCQADNKISKIFTRSLWEW